MTKDQMEAVAKARIGVADSNGEIAAVVHVLNAAANGHDLEHYANAIVVAEVVLEHARKRLNDIERALGPVVRQLANEVSA